VDKLDKFSALAICGLVLWCLLLLLTQPQGHEEQRHTPAMAGPRVDPALEQKTTLVKNLLASNNIDQAEKLLVDLVSSYPFEATLYFLKGDISLYRQDPLGAMSQYRQAVDLNPDFLDKKSPLFQGKKIKKTVEEARLLIEKGLAANPGDPPTLAFRKEYYYMLRKIAGSCG